MPHLSFPWLWVHFTDSLIGNHAIAATSWTQIWRSKFVQTASLWVVEAILVSNLLPCLISKGDNSRAITVTINLVSSKFNIFNYQQILERVMSWRLFSTKELHEWNADFIPIDKFGGNQHIQTHIILCNVIENVVCTNIDSFGHPSMC